MRVFVFLCLAALSTGAVPAAEPGQPQSVLMTVNTFAIGGVGVAGTISSGEQALRELLKQSDAVSRCQALVEKASPAGQLYGLLGLKWKDEAAFQLALKKHAGSRTRVQSMSGCILETVTVGEIAAEIQKGVWK